MSSAWLKRSQLLDELQDLNSLASAALLPEGWREAAMQGDATWGLRGAVEKQFSLPNEYGALGPDVTSVSRCNADTLVSGTATVTACAETLLGIIRLFYCVRDNAAPNFRALP